MKKSKFVLYCAALGLLVEPILFWLVYRVDSNITDWITLILWPSFIYTIDFFPTSKSEKAATWLWICILNPLVYCLVGLFFRFLFSRLKSLKNQWTNAG